MMLLFLVSLTAMSLSLAHSELKDRRASDEVIGSWHPASISHEEMGSNMFQPLWSSKSLPTLDFRSLHMKRLTLATVCTNIMAASWS